ncbi:hypothetical protein EYF80_004655 [Liparis tanakae]|uniref:Uncharacterized protein n=1 Tax=Liparis tanakae TaxID=230148 RepID=A0A4Z2J4Y0_9TELE|nr:hypothetical protein EYF80_004655 [Liparis tanakae]
MDASEAVPLCVKSTNSSLLRVPNTKLRRMGDQPFAQQRPLREQSLWPHHDHHQHQQEQQHYHPGQVLVDVKVIVGARPWGTPASRPVVAGDPTSTTSTPLPGYFANTNPDYLYTLHSLHRPLVGV